MTTKDKKRHKHTWKISSIGWEYTQGVSSILGTVVAQQYAYLLCQCCLVKKRKIEIIT